MEVEQGIHITAKERAALSKKLQVLGLGGVWEGNTNYEPLQRVDPEQTVPSISRKKAIHIKEDVVAIYHGTGGRKAPNLSAPSKNAPSGGKLAFGMQSLKDPLAASEGPVDYKALYKQVHQQLSAVSRQAGSEIQARDKEIKRLRKLCVVQQEQISKESSHITALSQALEEVKREGIAELNEARKTFSQLERRSIQVQRQAGAATAEQERALEEASAQIVSLRAERDRLAEALGVISAVTVGGRAALRGEMPDPHTIKQEAEAAKAEGAEPLPRNPGAWLKFSYATAAGKSTDVPTPAVPARKRGAVGSRRPPRADSALRRGRRASSDSACCGGLAPPHEARGHTEAVLRGKHEVREAVRGSGQDAPGVPGGGGRGRGRGARDRRNQTRAQAGRSGPVWSFQWALGTADCRFEHPEASECGVRRLSGGE